MEASSLGDSQVRSLHFIQRRNASSADAADFIAPRIPAGQVECSENLMEISWAVPALACNEGCKNSLQGLLSAAGCWSLAAGCWLLAYG